MFCLDLAVAEGMGEANPSLHTHLSRTQHPPERHSTKSVAERHHIFYWLRIIFTSAVRSAMVKPTFPSVLAASRS